MPSSVLQADWTAEEERIAKRKLDLAIMPLLTLGFFCLQLDRGNIANAITDTFMQDVGITQFQFNVGQQLLSLGIVLFEIPSNMILYKIGPGKWLTLQLFLFGLVSTFQAWQTKQASYLVTRFLLGVTEAGYIPGGLWTLSTWYTKKETAKRVLIFFFWQPAWPGRGQIDRLRDPPYARCCRTARLVPALCHHGEFYHLFGNPHGLPSSRLVPQADGVVPTRHTHIQRERPSYSTNEDQNRRFTEGKKEASHRRCSLQRGGKWRKI